ncbi:MAG: hypothetical protein JNJ83_13865 [Verrucomicrobiaceae bacterium]|nr:hypothetical protein [Verrucomicrobiaceae bacterium]
MSMQRPVFRWLLFALCVGLFVAALGWVTLRTLEMEKQNTAAARDAQLQEKLRLSLWRMDSMVSTLLVRENARPPRHYSAFYSPADLFSNASQTALPAGAALTPSPLLGDLPAYVNLHFEVTRQASGLMCVSPQVPTGKDLTLANNWYAISPQMQNATRKLSELNMLLQRHPLLPGTAETPSEPKAAVKPAPAALPVDQASDTLSVSRQTTANAVEFNQRLKISNVGGKNLVLDKALPRKATPAPAAAPAAPVASAGMSTATLERSKKADVATAPPKPVPAPSDLQPRWFGDELLLTRTAVLDGASRVQGLWLDWPRLKASLLDTIKDLLPQAKLVPTTEVGLDAASLVTLPVRLITGPVEVASVADSPLINSLLIAWACFVLAALAVALLLHRAIQLSERRGAFVSAVTHELRTPLTTFQLYSEMLADDMVPDAARRKEYLTTLCEESTRLTHLVENVLSYSRIERGRAAARKERVKLGQLLNRIEPRLRQRAAQCALEVEMSIAADAAETDLELDGLAVEQIVFNLVDNACKYAAAASTQPKVELHAKREHQRVVIEVRDFGPGIATGQLKKLFRPFEKSATEAAHSAPGVGLGLALCKRLARELGGDLLLVSNEGGASFQFTLPVAEAE